LNLKLPRIFAQNFKMRNVILSVVFIFSAYFGFAQTFEDSCFNSSPNYDCSCHIYLPNAFTPNADEFNNQFGPKVDCPLDLYQLTIINRWGQIVFESFDSKVLWDGTYNNKSEPNGLYLYYVRYRFVSDSETKVKSGHLTLL